MRISPELLDEIVDHAREEAPNECCGLIASEGGRAVRVYRAENAEHSPVRYVVEPHDQLRIQEEIEDQGWDLGAIYHSHTRSEPFPSQTDINLALTPDGEEEVWPGTLYVIAGVAGQDPDVRAFHIRGGGEVSEVPLEIG